MLLVACLQNPKPVLQSGRESAFATAPLLTVHEVTGVRKRKARKTDQKSKRPAVASSGGTTPPKKIKPAMQRARGKKPPPVPVHRLDSVIRGFGLRPERLQWYDTRTRNGKV